MNQLLFIKENTQLLKEDDYVIGNLTRRCKVGKVLSIGEKLIVIEIFDKYGDVDDVISRDIAEFNVSFFRAKKVDLDKDINYDYYIINIEN